MADALTKFNGTWLQEATDGDIDAWFKYEGVGWMMRNGAWLAGYGNGKTSVDALVHDNKYYTRGGVDDNSIFRAWASITGKKEPVLFSESFPLVDIRQMEAATTSAPDGSLEFVFFSPDGSEHSKAKRSVSEDGQVLTTAITFPAGDWGGEAGGTCTMTVTSRKQELAKLTPEVIGAWACQASTLAAATESGVEGKQKVVSESLEGKLPDASSLMKLLEETNRSGGGDKLEEKGPGKFTTTATNADGSQTIFEQAFDHEKHTFDVQTIHGGKSLGTWHFQAISEPLRLTCWNDMSNEMWSTRSSIAEVEKLADKVLAAAKK